MSLSISSQFILLLSLSGFGFLVTFLLVVSESAKKKNLPYKEAFKEYLKAVIKTIKKNGVNPIR